MIRDHGAALEYDLMVRTGRTLGEYWDMGPSGMAALVHFVGNLDADSALAREAGGMDAAEWSCAFKTNAVLADIYDALQWLHHSFASAHSKTKVKRPEPYPRPWAKKGETIGKGAIPISRFWDWWGSKEA